jgi:hypothetical protein
LRFLFLFLPGNCVVTKIGFKFAKLAWLLYTMGFICFAFSTLTFLTFFATFTYLALAFCFSLLPFAFAFASEQK